nr:hypothetical protein [Tanacetum cinerariifolium]
LFAKAFQLTTPTNNNQRTSSNIHNRQIAQPGINMSQDRQIYNIRGNGGNQFGQYAGQVVQNQQGYNAWQHGGYQIAQNAVQNPGVQNGGNQNRLVVVPGIANQNGTGDLNEIEEVNSKCILMANLQQESTSGTQLDKAPVYDTDGSAETTYKNLFDSITSNRAHAKLHNLIYENAKLRAQLFENTFESMNNTSRTSVTPQVDKPKLIAVTLCPKKLHASIPSCSVPQPREFNVVKHYNVITPGMFKINPSQTSRVDLVPNNQSSASIRTNPITNFQRRVTFKENVSSATVNSSSTRLVHTTRTRRPQPKGNTRNDRFPSASKSSEAKKNVIVEEHRWNLSLSKNQKTMSSKRNNIKLAIQNDQFETVCGTCKLCFVTANHDACLLSYVNASNSRANNLCANVPLVQIKRDIEHRFGNQNK